jgi:hypothetical protein
MSEQPVDEATEEYYAEAARRGQALAVLMLDAIDGKTGGNMLVMLNAIGNIVEGMFATSPLCDEHQLEEFDNWCAYTRSRLVAERQGEGETRQ